MAVPIHVTKNDSFYVRVFTVDVCVGTGTTVPAVVVLLLGTPGTRYTWDFKYCTYEYVPVVVHVVIRRILISDCFVSISSFKT